METLQPRLKYATTKRSDISNAANLVAVSTVSLDGSMSVTLKQSTWKRDIFSVRFYSGVSGFLVPKEMPSDSSNLFSIPREYRLCDAVPAVHTCIHMNV